MSAEDVGELVDRALEQAVASGADLDDVESKLEDALDRVDDIRELRRSR